MDWLMKVIPYLNRLCQKRGQILANELSTLMTKQNGCWNKGMRTDTEVSQYIEERQDCTNSN